jgi:hypothetical protein
MVRLSTLIYKRVVIEVRVIVVLRVILLGHIIRSRVINVVRAVVKLAIIESRVYRAAVPESRCSLPTALNVPQVELRSSLR